MPRLLVSVVVCLGLGGCVVADCSHGMPSPGSCVECMDEGNLPPLKRGRVRTGQPGALFAGFCGECDRPIHVGDPIDMGDEFWVHAGCLS